ncbi:hypothetical protein GF377_06675 [candidate division GN15 bacterium]|nr:hypothetical protein [candidate division GN15 bacterium]
MSKAVGWRWARGRGSISASLTVPAAAICGFRRCRLLRIRLLAIGKDKDQWVADGVTHFSKLLAKCARVSIDILPGLKSSGSLSPAEVMAQEAERFEKRLDDSYLVALSERGKRMDSRSFAREIERWQTVSGGTVTLLIGGAYGLDERLLARADQVLSLSRMTFSHQLVRLIILEQLYRGFSLLHGGPYHK